MTSLRAAVMRATDHIRNFYQINLGARPRGTLGRTSQGRSPIRFKRSFVG
jgi:hypothetical protein